MAVESSPFETPEWEETVMNALKDVQKWAAENPEPAETETPETPTAKKPADPAVEVMKVVKDALDKAITEKTNPTLEVKPYDVPTPSPAPAVVAKDATVENVTEIGKSRKPINPNPKIQRGQTVTDSKSGQPLKVVDASDPDYLTVKTKDNKQGRVRRSDVINPKDLVPNPKGGYEFGFIDEDMAKKMGSKPGPVRVQEGFQDKSRKDGGGYGKSHIDFRHLEEIRDAGFKTSEEFLDYALNGFTEIWDQGKGRYLVIKKNGRNSLTVVELARENSNFYTVDTGWALSKDNLENYMKSLQKKGAHKVWEREATDSHAMEARMSQAPKSELTSTGELLPAGNHGPMGPNLKGSNISITDKSVNVKSAENIADLNKPSAGESVKFQAGQYDGSNNIQKHDIQQGDTVYKLYSGEPLKVLQVTKSGDVAVQTVEGKKVIIKQKNIRITGSPEGTAPYEIKGSGAGAFVNTPKGNFVYGQIDDIISKASNRPIGSILLQKGNRNFGETKIAIRHGKQIVDVLGYPDVRTFVHDVLNNWTDIYEGKEGHLLFIKNDGDHKMVAIDLGRTSKDFYTVLSAYEPTESQIKRYKPILTRLVYNKKATSFSAGRETPGSTPENSSSINGSSEFDKSQPRTSIRSGKEQDSLAHINITDKPLGVKSAENIADLNKPSAGESVKFQVGQDVSWTTTKGRHLHGKVVISKQAIINGKKINQYVVKSGGKHYAVTEDQIEQEPAAIPATEGATRLVAEAGRAGVTLSRDDIKNVIVGETEAVEDIESRTAQKRAENKALDDAVDRVRRIETRKHYDLIKKELAKKISPKKRTQLEGILESDTEYQDALATLRNEQQKATTNALKADRSRKILQAQAAIDKEVADKGQMTIDEPETFEQKLKRAERVIQDSGSGVTVGMGLNQELLNAWGTVVANLIRKGFKSIKSIGQELVRQYGKLGENIKPFLRRIMDRAAVIYNREMKAWKKEAGNSDNQTLYRQAEAIHQKVVSEYQPKLDSIGNEIAARIGGTYQGTAKSVKSIVQKVTRKKSDGATYDVNSPKDHARGVIIVNSWNNVYIAIEMLKNKGFSPEITIDNPLNIFGYRGINNTISLGNGINGEIQIHTKNSWKLKQYTDSIYRKWRDLTQKDIQALSETRPELYKQHNKDIIRCWKLWDAYWGKIPLEIKARISSSGKGLDSHTDPIVTPLADTHESSESTLGPLSESQSIRPSVNFDIKNRENIDQAPVKGNISITTKAFNVKSAGNASDLNLSRTNKAETQLKSTSWSEKVENAKKRLRAFFSGRMMFTGIPLNIVHDLTIVGADLIRKGFKKAGPWATELVRLVGSKRLVGINLNKIYQASVVYHGDMVRTAKLKRMKDKYPELAEGNSALFDIDSLTPETILVKAEEDAGKAIGKESRQILKSFREEDREVEKATRQEKKAQDRIDKAKKQLEYDLSLRAKQELAAQDLGKLVDDLVPVHGLRTYWQDPVFFACSG